MHRTARYIFSDIETRDIIVVYEDNGDIHMELVPPQLLNAVVIGFWMVNACGKPVKIVRVQ